jgi:hypothetical protein
MGSLTVPGVTESARISSEPLVIKAPFDVPSYFYPSGWMGDAGGPDGKKHLDFNDQWKDKCHSGSMCIQIRYRPASQGWAGVYWLYPDSNWGDQPGRVVEGATKISFWARGQAGGEVLTFKAGGSHNKKYVDSFEKVNLPEVLTTDWKHCEISLRGADTHSVIGAFAWSTNCSGGCVFYLDEIRYE